MGFPEISPAQVRENITRSGETLISRANGRQVRCGRLAIPRLDDLRRTKQNPGNFCATLAELVGDVRALHEHPENAGAVFQVASQFNLLEMATPSITPEMGVGIYERDLTQGPACAIACGGGTIFRNYFVELDGQMGQTADVQIDCLADLELALGGPGLWEMRNGYALLTLDGLDHINHRLARACAEERRFLQGLVRVGVQHDVEVIGTEHIVTQVYGSALPVSYGDGHRDLWEPLARLILEASYEATILIAHKSRASRLFLTLLGGGAFGNESVWIADSILQALSVPTALRIYFVSYRRPNPAVASILATYTGSAKDPETARPR